MSVTREQVVASLNAIKAIADTIKELGVVPSGQLYGTLVGVMDLNTYESLVSRLVGAGLVKKNGNMLVWVG